MTHVWLPPMLIWCGTRKDIRPKWLQSCAPEKSS